MIPMTFAAADGEKGLEKALDALCAEAEARVDAGYTMLILTDREVSMKRAPIPALLTTSALHHHLTRVKKRHLTALVIETAEAREVMHFATLMGFGASAINPYLAIETIADLKERGRLQELPHGGDGHRAVHHSIKKGLLKVMSKMGVSTIRSYKSAQIFEAVGLGGRVHRRSTSPAPLRASAAWASTPSRARSFRGTRPPSPAPRRSGKAWTPAARSTTAASPKVIACPRRQSRCSSAPCGRATTTLYKQYAATINDESQPAVHAPRAVRLHEAGRRWPWIEVEPVEIDRQEVRHLGHVLRLHQQGSARDARHRHEPSGRGEQLGRGRRGRSPLRAPAQRGLDARAPSSRWPRRASA